MNNRQKVTATIMSIAMLVVLFSHAIAIEPSSFEDAERKAQRLAIQAKFKDMPEVKLNRVKADVKFEIVDMRESLVEVGGKKYCAFRFKTGDKVSQLTWCFRLPPGIRGWYILPEEGRMDGFFNFDKFVLNEDRAGWGSLGDLFAVQSLPSRYFDANQDYIIWFHVRDAADSAINLSLNMTPVPDGSTYSAVFPTITLAD